MKRYVNFIKEQNTFEQFKNDYDKLNKMIGDFENGFIVGFQDQFSNINNRTPEDVKSISNKNIAEMKQERERKNTEREQDVNLKKETAKLLKIDGYFKQLLDITKKFNNPLYDEILKFYQEFNKVKKVSDIPTDKYLSLVANINKSGILNNIDVNEYRKNKNFYSVKELINNINSQLGVKNPEITIDKIKIYQYDTFQNRPKYKRLDNDQVVSYDSTKHEVVKKNPVTT